MMILGCGVVLIFCGPVFGVPMASLRSFAFVCFVAVTMAAAPASAQLKWNLVSAYPAGNFHTENLYAFAKDMSAVTGGKLVITVYPNASLFPAAMITSAVRIGQAQIGEILLS